MSPAVENTRSDGTEVAGMHKYFLASRDKYGYFSHLFLHQSRGFCVAQIGGSFLYSETSNSHSSCMDFGCSTDVIYTSPKRLDIAEGFISSSTGSASGLDLLD